MKANLLGAEYSWRVWVGHRGDSDGTGKEHSSPGPDVLNLVRGSPVKSSS